jgi:hypothetical protein
LPLDAGHAFPYFDFSSYRWPPFLSIDSNSEMRELS